MDRYKWLFKAVSDAYPGKIVLLFIFLTVSGNSFALKLQAGDIFAGDVRIKSNNGEQAVLGLGMGGRDVIAMDGAGRVLQAVTIGTGATAITRYNLQDDSQDTIFPNGVLGSILGLTYSPSGQIFTFDSQSVSRIDPATQQQTIISSGLAFSNLVAIGMDTNGDVLVVDNGNKTLFSVNPVSGLTTPISNGGNFTWITAVAVDNQGDYLVLNDGLPQIIKVDRTNGSQTDALAASFKDTQGNPMFFSKLTDLIVASNGDYIISTDQNSNPRGIFRVDPSTGTTSVLNSNFVLVNDMVASGQDEVLAGAAESFGATGLFRVNTLTGQTQILHFGRFVLGQLDRLAVNSTGDIFEEQGDKIQKIASSTGERTIIASGGLLSNIVGIEVESDGNVVVADAGSDSVVRVNPATGAQNLVTSGNNIGFVVDLALSNSGEIFVAPAFIGATSPIVRVDPATGAQTAIATAGFANNVHSIAIDANDDVIIAAGNPVGVLKMVSATGVITTIAPGGTNGNIIDRPRDVAVAADGTIVVSDSDAGAVVLVDPTNGAESILASGGFLPSPATRAGPNRIAIVPGGGTTAPTFEDLVIDFGGIGLWARMNDASWLKLNNASPTLVSIGDMDDNGEDDTIAVFGNGIFVKRNLGPWAQLHNFIPQQMATGDLDNNGKDDVVIDFGGIGLWARMNDASWLKLNNASPAQVATGDVDGNGEDDVIAVFASGIFVKRNQGGWAQLHNFIPDAITTGDLDGNGKDDVVIDFGGIGLWARMNDSAWSKLHNSSPDLIAIGDTDGNGADDVLATFGSSFGGLWQKQNLVGWVQLNANAADAVIAADVDGSGADDVVGNFGSTLGGIYVKRNQGAWAKLHNSTPDSLVAGQLDGN